MGDSIKSFIEVKVDYIFWYFVHVDSWFCFLKATRLIKHCFSPEKSILTISNYITLLCVLGSGFQKDALHDLSRA